jgi:uncharacterized protein
MVRNVNDRSGMAVLGGLIALGLMVGGWLLGVQIKNMRLADRDVTVKGLVERNVKSDLAIWPLQLQGNGRRPDGAVCKDRGGQESDTGFSAAANDPARRD